MEPFRVLSLGAGVQSSTLLLMSLAGELEPLDAVIFADTQWEPRAVYEHLQKLEFAMAADRVPFYRVTAGSLRNDALDGEHRFASMPLHVRQPDGRKGMIRRQCTREYKIAPIRRQVRALHLAANRRPVEQWIGISLDEVVRIKPSDVKYITHRWPLIERRMTRWDCRRYLESLGWHDVPKSACKGCPFRNDAGWRDLRDHDPDGWNDAVAFDREIRRGHKGGVNNVELRALGAYLHHSCRPLDQADLSTPEDRGQLNLFDNDCTGMCGI